MATAHIGVFVNIMKKGTRLSDEHKKKISDATKGKPNSGAFKKGEVSLRKGVKLSDETRRKLSLIRVGKTPYNKGIPMSEEQKKKVSDSKKGQIPWNKGLKGAQIAWNKGIPMSEEQKDTLSTQHTGMKASEHTKNKMSEKRREWLEAHPEYNAVIKKSSSKMWASRPDLRKNMSQRLLGKNNHNYGRPPRHGKGSYYNGIIWMRSSYEVAYALYLDEHKIKWIYEPPPFELGDTSYIPDFYLPEYDIYIEIKGYMRKDAEYKLKLFKETYPTIHLDILTRNDLVNMGVLGK